MEIFNIHIFEFILIAGLALVVFGPERLPEVGRFIGKQVARFLAWQQQSPELKMINDVRGEFEREIANLRDELVRTRNQLDVSKDVSQIQEQLKSAFDLRPELQSAVDAAKGASTAGAAPEPTIAPPADAATSAADAATSAADAAASAADAADTALKAAEVATDAAELAAEAAANQAPTPQLNRVAGTQPTNLFDRPAPVTPAQPRNSHDAAPSDEAAPASLGAADDGALLRRLEGLVADMQALVEELQGRGLIGPDWQLPSQASQQESITR